MQYSFSVMLVCSSESGSSFWEDFCSEVQSYYSPSTHGRIGWKHPSVQFLSSRPHKTQPATGAHPLPAQLLRHCGSGPRRPA